MPNQQSQVNPADFVNAIRQFGERSAPSAVSRKGAVTTMQVLPSSATNPGFGVRPAQSNDPAELERVGRDYATALLQHFGDPTLAAAAYDAGPNKVNQWIDKFGDPRNGDLSTADFVKRIPYSETRGYVQRVTGAIAPQMRGSDNQLSAITPAAVSDNSLSPAPGFVQYINAIAHSLEPVSHDPFAYTAEQVAHNPFTTAVEAVGHDPFAEEQSQ